MIVSPMLTVFLTQRLLSTNKKEYKRAIKDWIEDANRQFKITMEATKYSETGANAILTAIVSGDFDGSPAALITKWNER